MVWKQGLTVLGQLSTQILDALCHVLPRSVDDPFWIKRGGREVDRCVVNPAWA